MWAMLHVIWALGGLSGGSLLLEVIVQVKPWWAAVWFVALKGREWWPPVFSSHILLALVWPVVWELGFAVLSSDSRSL